MERAARSAAVAGAVAQHILDSLDEKLLFDEESLTFNVVLTRLLGATRSPTNVSPLVELAVIACEVVEAPMGGAILMAGAYYQMLLKPNAASLQIDSRS